MHFEGEEKASMGKCGKDHVKRMCLLRVTDSSDYLYHPSEGDLEVLGVIKNKCSGTTSSFRTSCKKGVRGVWVLT